MLSETDLATCIRRACELEVMAPKPGNVNPQSDGHDMLIDDFLRSAAAIAPVMARPEFTVGERILAGVQATRKVVNCNTNLGIILLFAPIIQAVYQSRHFLDIRPMLRHVLATLTVYDAELSYQAIQLAEAGGLGKQVDQDISRKPTITLLAAMKLAENRDTIARQYTNNFNEVWEIAFKQLTKALNCGEKVEWAAAFAYLNVLARVPDTLISRKYSRRLAQSTSEQAQRFIAKMTQIASIHSLQDEFHDWDQQLKRQAINPGTTADMIAAALLLHQLSETADANRISVAQCI
ncbi:Triphosphoribosyl-dephospho-CoA synthetase [Methylophaga frappieri]|uniref:Triphosphoribosyl-dephospho-CoA synthetase n=1 Tax=Methylophaga frappieri (strain ATCC BAA-2434 / DSM 25690 / JAM7) TaxID=754477 RepID=I1YJ22_METFJ|nr:triphosphoribosyl-dephospho-CoA synthase [Methylophaga frappieri]AFJ02915.1 Triphosphoribosyl-dephospho-CoA synthetase [Methylophaga frappieri]